MCEYHSPEDDNSFKGDDTMSAGARNFIYEMHVKKDANKKEPVVDQKKLEEFKKAVAKYLGDK